MLIRVLISLLLALASATNELATEQTEVVEQASSLQEQKIQATLQATIANAKQESNRALIQNRQDKESKLSLLKQVQLLQEQKQQALDRATSLATQLGQAQAQAKRSMEQQKMTESVIEGQKKNQNELLAKERKKVAEYVKASTSIVKMIRDEMPEKEQVAQNLQQDLLLLDEGAGASTTTPNVLIKNARDSLDKLKEERLRVEGEAKKQAVAETRKATKADSRSVEELDMARFEDSLNHLDDTRPLMEQLGI